ncbi:MAG: hypothetical protein Q8868_11570 [Bacteroidota bacterium]|nr:hypothetical protein [Bacteroidota bacterium]
MVLVILFSSLLTVCGQEQRKEAPPFKDRLFYGGSFGLQFGTFTDISVSPVVGLWALSRINVALGPDFRYYKFPGFHTTIYGGKLYTELVFVEDFNNIIPLGVHLGLFLHAEDEVLSLESEAFKSPPYNSNRFLISTILVGGGVRQQMGLKSSLNFTFLWALNNSEYGIYGNPEIRISFFF